MRLDSIRLADCYVQVALTFVFLELDLVIRKLMLTRTYLG